MKRLIYILLIGCCHLTAQASDTIRIVGTITDEQGEPIIGANIKAHDSIGNELSRGTVSDYDGKFYLVTQRSQNVKYLVVSYICCFPDTIYLTDEPLQKYDITLKFRDDNCWDDVIVTGCSPSLLSDTFFYQWHKQSEEFARFHSLHSNATIDSVFQQVFLHYSNRTTHPYIVLPKYVPVTILNADFDEKNYRSMLDIKKDSSFIISVDSTYIPHLNVKNPVLYLFTKQEEALSTYLGGVPTSNEINRKNAGKVAQYMEINYGHWGGYWHLETMPIIYKIYIYDNGAYISLRDSWCSGKSIFIPTHSNEFIEVSSWIE